MHIPYSWDDFTFLYVLDSEYIPHAGDQCTPVAYGFLEVRTGRSRVLFQDELANSLSAPIHLGPETLVIVFNGQAEIGFHSAMQWERPTWLLDLQAEMRDLSNAPKHYKQPSLLASMQYFKLDAMSADSKDANRALIMGGGPWDAEERGRILRYCLADVYATRDLFDAMKPLIRLRAALHRGAFVSALACMETRGIPMDIASYREIQRHWGILRHASIHMVDPAGEIFSPEGTIAPKRLATWLAQRGFTNWPRTKNGLPSTRREVFARMAEKYPTLLGFAECLQTLDVLKEKNSGEPYGPAVGRDGRARTSMFSFGTITGRVSGNTSEGIFLVPRWYRGLITPPIGKALISFDYSQQEYAIAAGLSQDKRMIENYLRGDPYFHFGVAVGAFPPDSALSAVKATRDQLKQTTLAAMYGQRERGLAERLQCSQNRARILLNTLHKSFPAFRKWQTQIFRTGIERGFLRTKCGWTLHILPKTKRTTLFNWPIQAGGADVLQVACILADNAGIRLVATVHDSIVVECLCEEVEETINNMQTIMSQAGEMICGVPLRTEVTVVHFGERMLDMAGQRIWDYLWAALKRTTSAT